MLVVTLLGAAPRVFAAGAVEWRELGEPVRTEPALVWDSRRGRALMFGGDGEFATPFPGAWQLLRSPSSHWEPLATRGDGPAPRSGWSAVYDSLRDRVLLFGGRGVYPGLSSNELWELRLAGVPEWTRLDAGAGASPPARFGAAMVLDARDRLVLFGGDGEAFADSNVWILPLAEAPLHWRMAQIPGPGPGPRARAGAAYSALTNRLVVFGGDHHIRSGNFLDDYPVCAAVTWELPLDEPLYWLQRSSAPADSAPLPQVGATLTADAAGRYAWLIPGDQGFDWNDPSVWRYDVLSAVWTRALSGADGPGLQAGAAACLVSATGELLVQGGGPSFRYSYPGAGTSPATWRLTTGPAPAWSPEVASPVLVNGPTRDPRAHFDALTRRLFIWNRAGVWTKDVTRSDAWRLEPDPGGNGPPYEDAMSVLDPARRRLLVFGGFDGRSLVTANRLWSWPLDGPPAWSSADIGGDAPSGIWGTQCAYDPARDRVLILPSSGGYLGQHLPLDTLSALELNTGAPHWAKLATAGVAPVWRSDASVLVDVDHDRLALAGGVVPGGDGRHPRDLWTLSLADTPRWTEQISVSQPKDPSARCGLAIDPTLDRLLLIGGIGLAFLDFGESNTLRSASLEDPTGWTDLDPESASPMRGAGTSFFDAVADRMLWWNGRSLWQVTWPLVTPPPFGPATVTSEVGRVHVSWPGAASGPYLAVVERSIDGGSSWQRPSHVASQAGGSLAFDDTLPPVSGALAYRALIDRSGTLHVLGTASLALPRIAAPAFGGAALRPNPAHDQVVVEFASPGAANVSAELFDLSGRRVGATLRRSVRVGEGPVALPLSLPHDLAPGVYLVRVSDGTHAVRARLAVIR